MKKFARILALMLVAAMLCVVLAACGGAPAEDPKDAKKALKDADYKVTLIDDEDALEYYDYDGLEAILYAEKVDPEMTMDELDEWEDLDGETVTFEKLVVYYFEDEDAAEEAFEDLEKYLEGLFKGEQKELDATIEDVAEELDVEVEIEFEWEEVVLDGCMVYIGTSGALSDAS